MAETFPGDAPMANGQVRSLLRQIRRVIDPRQGGLPDAELLERFVRERDEAAFEVLLWRHGPMVLNLCRRLLHQEQDAEDAFQATFLTLVRKARSIGRADAVASWLYRVAHRIALAARAHSARPINRLLPLLDPAVDETTPDFIWRELRLVLDEEVNRLPSKYRTPFVLCYLEGRTNEEAAQELGCPKGTILSRLSRARERLRRRLLQRGVMLSGTMLACVLTEKAAADKLPSTLVESTLGGASLVAKGKATAGIISTQTSLLMEGAVRAMFVTKLRLAAVVVMALGLLGSGAGVLAHWAGAPLVPAFAQGAGDDDTRQDPRRDFTPPSQRRSEANRMARARMQSLNNLKQIGLAMHNYHDVYGSFPSPAIYGKDGKALLSWRVLLLPYLEQQHLYQQFKLDEPWDGPHNRRLLSAMPKVYAPIVPTRGPQDSTYYQVFVGPDEQQGGAGGGAVLGGAGQALREVGDAKLGGGGSVPPAGAAGTAVVGGTGAGNGGAPGVGPIFVKHHATKLTEITDGTSNTILAIEGGSAVPWTKPQDLPYAADEPLPRLAGEFPDAVLTLFGDGSVHALALNLPEATMRALITRNGGEVVDFEKVHAPTPGGPGRGGDLREENQRLREQLEETNAELDIMRKEVDLLKQRARLRHRAEGQDTGSSELRDENAQLTKVLEQAREEMRRLQASIDALRNAVEPTPTRRRD
jgi:RNA polymerase sigma factor (sigma-70 family)